MSDTYTDAQMLFMVCLALEDGLEGITHAEDLNRTVVNMIAYHWGTFGENSDPAVVEEVLGQLKPYIPDHLLVEGE